MQKGKLAQINSITDTVPFKHSHSNSGKPHIWHSPQNHTVHIYDTTLRFASEITCISSILKIICSNRAKPRDPAHVSHYRLNPNIKVFTMNTNKPRFLSHAPNCTPHPPTLFPESSHITP